MPSAAALDGAALTLLDRLTDDTQRASDALGAEDVAGLFALLDARETMFAALRKIGVTAGRSGQASETRAELVRKTSELQHANVALMQRMKRECDRLASAIAALDRPDPVAGAYATLAAPGHLNLRR
jgi:hypothetical protein